MENKKVQITEGEFCRVEYNLVKYSVDRSANCQNNVRDFAKIAADSNSPENLHTMKFPIEIILIPIIFPSIFYSLHTGFLLKQKYENIRNGINI